MNPRNEFDKYNFFSNKLNWTELNKKLAEIEWDDLANDSPDVFINKMTERILRVVRDYVPLRSYNSKKKGNNSKRQKDFIS